MAALVSQIRHDVSLPQIKVPDTKKAMTVLAAWYRRKLDLIVVGITGSLGKTTPRRCWKPSSRLNSGSELPRAATTTISVCR